MRILIDANPVIHGERAVQRNSRNLIDHLVRRDSDIEYILFYHDWRGNRNPRIALPTGGIHREYVCRLPGRLLEWSWRHYAWPTVESFVGSVDLVYATDLIFPPSRKSIILTTLRGIAYIAIPELTTSSHTVSLKNALDYAIRESDYFLAVSQQTKRDLVDFLNISDHRIWVSTHGVDPTMRHIEDANLVNAYLKEHFNLQKPYLLYVGAISHNKNILRMIGAFSQIREDFPDLMLALAGPFENAYAEAVQFVEKVGLTHRVCFLGSLSPDSDDLVYLYNGAEILLHFSLYEGWTAPPLEAMACGTPVIASDYTSIPETCGDAAYFVDPMSIESAVNGIKSVLVDQKFRESLIERGFHRVKECQWSRSAEHLENIFMELIKLHKQ